MDHLWAPWRMAYIESSGGRDEGCIFCVKPEQDRDEENLILLRSTHCFVIMNRFPYNNGHLMIAPYQHVGDIGALDAPTLADMMATVHRSLAAEKASLHQQCYHTSINQDTAAPAGY